MPCTFLAWWQDNSGQGVSEFALLTAAIVILVVVVMFGFRGEVEALINASGDYMNSRL